MAPFSKEQTSIFSRGTNTSQESLQPAEGAWITPTCLVSHDPSVTATRDIVSRSFAKVITQHSNQTPGGSRGQQPTNQQGFFPPNRCHLIGCTVSHGRSYAKRGYSCEANAATTCRVSSSLQSTGWRSALPLVSSHHSVKVLDKISCRS